MEAMALCSVTLMNLLKTLTYFVYQRVFVHIIGCTSSNNVVRFAK